MNISLVGQKIEILNFRRKLKEN